MLPIVMHTNMERRAKRVNSCSSSWYDGYLCTSICASLSNLMIFFAVFQTFVQHCVGRFVPGQRLFGQMLMGLCQTFHFGKASVESHCRVSGVLGHIQVSCSPQLLFNHQSLFQQLYRERTRQREGERGRESETI